MFSTTRTRFGIIAAALAVLASASALRIMLTSRDAQAQAANMPSGKAASTAPTDPDTTVEPAPSSYPVVTTSPVRRTVADVVRGFGTVHADARNARSVTSATLVAIAEVLVLPGQRVKRGQALLRVEPDPAAFLAYQQAVSAMTLASNEVKRLTDQRTDGLATTTQLETAQKALIDAQAATEAARRQGAARETAIIGAPIDGIVTSLGVVAGDRPAVGTALMSISPLPDRVSLGIEPGLQDRVHVGDHVTVRAVQGDTQPRSGTVAQVGSAVDTDTRLVIVSVLLNQGTTEPYLNGITVEGTIDTRTINAFSLPRAALVKGDDGVSIFEIRGGKAHRVPVAVVSDDGPRVAVTGELDPARAVVSTGAYELEDGVDVEEHKP